ncbi:hypothetical protein F5884DRAFT_248957 [Xylogone sp. PMI_703]|nr:hypothetical protein F5884DRAFT_248957 [Xylogone sp. PMI_703]
MDLDSASNSDFSPGGCCSHETSDGTYFYSKYGKIEILRRENYRSFEITCQLALLCAGAWDIIEQEIPRPTLEEADDIDKARREQTAWDKKALEAIRLFTFVVPQRLLRNLFPMFMAKDIAGVWKALAKEYAPPAEICAMAESEFRDQRWDPEAETLQSFVDRLETYRTKVWRSSFEISDEAMLSHLYSQLPNGHIWAEAKILCWSERRDLPGAIALLTRYEKLSHLDDPSPEPAMSNRNRSRRLQEKRNRRERFRHSRQPRQ